MNMIEAMQENGQKVNVILILKNWDLTNKDCEIYPTLYILFELPQHGLIISLSHSNSLLNRNSIHQVNADGGDGPRVQW